jgi:hypothetical protein
VDEIRDGDDYSLAIPARLHACFVFPASMFDADECPPGSKIADPAAFPSKVRLLAIAVFRLGVDSGTGLVQLTVSMNQMGHSYQPFPASARAFADGITRGIPQSFAGATVRGGTADVRLVTANGLPMARFAYDVDGLSPQSRRFAHGVMLAVWSPEGAYTYTLNSRAEDAAAADAMADEMATSVRIAHLAPPAPPEARGP